MSDQSKLEFDSSESWVLARRVAGVLGEVPNSFSSTIRAMLLDEERNKSLSPGTKFLALRLLKTVSVRVPIYFGTLTFSEEKIAGIPYLAPDFFLEAFRPTDLAGMIGLIYLYRRAKKIAPDDEWEYISPPLQTVAEIGGHVGTVIPAIGTACGVLGAGLQHVARACFLIRDKKGYVEHRRLLKNKNLRFDRADEQERFGCTSVQVGSVLIQALGFGVELAGMMTKGLSPMLKDPAELDKGSYRFYINNLWIESLLETGKVPNITHRGEFYPTKAAVEKIEAKAQEIRSTGPRHSWLDRGKDDINPETAPQLCEATPEGESVVQDQEVEKLMDGGESEASK